MNEAQRVHERARLQVLETQDPTSLPVGIDLGTPTLVVAETKPLWFALLRAGRAWLKPAQVLDAELRELAGRAALLGLSLEAETLPNEDLQAGTDLSRLVSGSGTRSAAEPGASTVPTDPEQPKLTDREMEVLQLLSEGWSNQEIGRFSKLSLGTVKFHLAHIFEKLGAANRAEAVRRAAESGLLQF